MRASLIAPPMRLPISWRRAAALWVLALVGMVALGMTGRGELPARPSPAAEVAATAAVLPPQADRAVDPLTARRTATRTVIDGIAAGIPFAWVAARVYDDGAEPAVLDSVELVDGSPGLAVLRTAIVPDSAVFAGASRASDEALLALAREYPVRGSAVRPVTDPAWRGGAWLVLVLAVPTPGDYVVDSLLLRYHVDREEFAAGQETALEICAGAVIEDPSEGCPWAPTPGAPRRAFQSRPA